MKKLANNKKVLDMSNKIANAIELEAEDILRDAEEVIKKYVPARKVKATLASIEKELDKEGIESIFDKSVTREAIRKTASEKVSDEEIKELAKAVVDAIVEEFEDVLKDADEACDDTVASFNDEVEDPMEIECKLKSSLEKTMASKGIYCRLDRNNKAKVTASKKSPVKKMTLLEKIRNNK